MENLENNNNSKLVGICGLYCGACDNYLAFQPGHDHLLTQEKFVKDRENEYCEGCNSNKVSLHCSQCYMRACAKQKEIINCAYCSEYPCDEITKFKSDAEKWDGAKHRKYIFINNEELVKEGEMVWLNNQKIQWTCECGKAFSFYETNCSSCGKKLNSYY